MGAHLATFDPLIPKKAALSVRVGEASSLPCVAEPDGIQLRSRNLEFSSQIDPGCGDAGLPHEISCQRISTAASRSLQGTLWVFSGKMEGLASY